MTFLLLTLWTYTALKKLMKVFVTLIESVGRATTQAGESWRFGEHFEASRRSSAISARTQGRKGKRVHPSVLYLTKAKAVVKKCLPKSWYCYRSSVLETWLRGNVLLTDRNLSSAVAKLGDFGLPIDFGNRLPLPYLPPEIVNSYDQTPIHRPESDVW